ncbi:MAG: hypothetical protein WCF90_10585 [Methanomicrobiales archaeon]
MAAADPVADDSRPDLAQRRGWNFLSCDAMFERFFGAREADLLEKTNYDFVDSKLANFFRENDWIVMAAVRPA